jgi:kynureninase
MAVSKSVERDVRAEFALPEGIYLYSHAVGCLPHVAKQGAQEYFAQWAALGGNAWDPWLEEVARFNMALAKLLNARVEDICPQVNLSSALTKVITALPKRPGRHRIVLSLLDFPTIGFVAMQAEKLGYRVEFAGTDDVSTDPRTSNLGNDVALVIWTHAYPNTGTVVEPPTRDELQGAYLCVDIAQSAGVIPIDVDKWDADFIIGSCVKFLCGGAGAGYLWVRPDLEPQLEPIDVGWFSHARPFEFDITSFEYAPNAARFWGGTPSVLPYAVAARSIELINDIGVARVRGHNIELLDVLRRGAEAKGINVLSPVGGQQSGTLVLDFGDNWENKLRLNAAGVHCDSRKFGMRLSPHIYNTREEMEAVVELF